MKKPQQPGVATRIAPHTCGSARKGVDEAWTGECARDVQTAKALERRVSAALLLPPTVRLSSAREASERARSAWPTDVAWATYAVSSPATPTEVREDS